MFGAVKGGCLLRFTEKKKEDGDGGVGTAVGGEAGPAGVRGRGQGPLGRVVYGLRPSRRPASRRGWTPALPRGNAL